MAQGKLKKTKTPVPIKKKQKTNSSAFTRRSNAPIMKKKSKLNDHQKIQQVISKTLNKNVECELRGRATDGVINLTKAQQAVIKHHKTMTANIEAKSASTSAAASTMGD